MFQPDMTSTVIHTHEMASVPAPLDKTIKHANNQTVKTTKHTQNQTDKTNKHTNNRTDMTNKHTNN